MLFISFTWRASAKWEWHLYQMVHSIPRVVSLPGETICICSKRSFFPQKQTQLHSQTFSFMILLSHCCFWTKQMQTSSFKSNLFSPKEEKAWTLQSSQPNVKKKKKAIYCLWTWEVSRCIWWSMWCCRGKCVISALDTLLTHMTWVMDLKKELIFFLKIELRTLIFYHKISLLLAG